MSYRADKLVIDARTDRHTHRQTQATTIPEGQYWPRVKMHLITGYFFNKEKYHHVSYILTKCQTGIIGNYGERIPCLLDNGKPIWSNGTDRLQSTIA